jgi:alginate O-acetyltransferase complex protein AlgI
LPDFILGHLIHRSGPKVNRKKLFFLATSIFFNLGFLAYFKYAYFLTGIFNEISGKDAGVVNFLTLIYNRLFNENLDVSVIVLPVGISFFTFQTISYTVDIYRKKLKPLDNIVDFGFYVSFFPQLVAGPIVRAAEFIPQIYGSFRLSMQEMGHAVFLIMNGLIKKDDHIRLYFCELCRPGI